MNTNEPFPIADLHCDTVVLIQRGYDISIRNDNHHVDIPRLKEGNINLQVFACGSLYADRPADHFNNVIRQIDLLKSEFSKNSDSIELCLKSDDITRANSEGKIAAIISIEGGQALNNDPSSMEMFYSRGVRLLTLAHELPLDWCGIHKDDDASTRGLNELGRDMVMEMNNLGIVIDLSHSGDKTAEDVLSLSKTPVVASHSNARALCNHTRNLPDYLIESIAESGGVIGVTFVNNFISKNFDDAYEKFWSTVPKNTLKELLKLYSQEMPEHEYKSILESDFKFIIEGEKSYRHMKPGMPEILDHLDYMANLTGSDHIGIGSDFDGISSTPKGLDDCSKIKSLVSELSKHDYTPSQIEAISIGNFIRVFRDICG